MPQLEELLPLLGPLGLVLLFAPMWVGVVTLISVTSGWRRLGHTFLLRDPTPPVPTSLATGSMGWAQYKNSLKLGADQDALYIGVFFLFRFSHPWLRIPWSHVHDDGTSGLIFKQQQLTLDPDGLAVRFRIPLRTWERLSAARPPDQYSG